MDLLEQEKELSSDQDISNKELGHSKYLSGDKNMGISLSETPTTNTTEKDDQLSNTHLKYTGS